MSRDSIGNILRVSILLCLVCAIGVSVAAVGLKSAQERNKRLDQQRNILMATGNYEADQLDSKTVASEFAEKVEVRYVNIETGEEVPVEQLPKGKDYDPRAAAGDAKLQYQLPKEAADTLAMTAVAPYYPVYFIKGDGGQLDTVVLPIVGKGLWSTMYGFLALEPDYTTVRGINYYEHGETPGLGGEVDNPLWKNQWKEKVAYKDGKPAIDVIKGSVSASDPNAEHKIDGLAGATITANGVENSVNFWLSENGFGKYLQKQRGNQQASNLGEELKRAG